jgi:Protein of unknown function (DUF4239)
MNTLLLGFLIVSLGIVLSWLGLRTVRRFVPVALLKAHHEVAGFIIGVLGAIYAVLLAFVVVALWNQYEDARSAVEREANQLGDLAHITRGFADQKERHRLTGMIGAYTGSAITDEWPAMAQGKASLRTQSALDQLWRVYLEIDPETYRDSTLYDQSVSTLRDLSDSRRLRLFASRNDLPILIQLLLWGGGVITISFTYFFGVESIRAQSLMTAGLTGIIAFNLFLVLALDNPFHGFLRVSPELLRDVLERVQSIESS